MSAITPRRALAVILLLACANTGHTQERFGPLVDVAWLATNLDAPNTVILHVGSPSGYSTGHLPGARQITDELLVAPAAAGGLGLEMPDARQLARDLGVLGVTADSRIVVVFAQDWVTSATRILTTLRYAGLGDHAALLDGGQAAWVAAGHPLSTQVPAAGTGQLSVRPQTAILADLATVQAAQRDGNVRIIDARAPVYYNGPPHMDDLPGHIPGAVNLPYSTLVGADRKLLPPARLAELFRNAGIAPGQSVIVYCHIGEQATLVFTAATIVGIPVRLYDGSFDEWSKRKLPTEGWKAPQ